MITACYGLVSLRGMLLVREYLETHPCVDCGEADARVLEFDHLGEKNFTIGNALTTRGMDLDILAKEISLCVVRCANCHRKKTLVKEAKAQPKFSRRHSHPAVDYKSASQHITLESPVPAV